MVFRSVLISAQVLMLRIPPSALFLNNEVHSTEPFADFHSVFTHLSLAMVSAAATPLIPPSPSFSGRDSPGNGKSQRLSLFYATLCVIDLFGVFPIVALPSSIISCGLYGIPLVLFVITLQIYTAVRTIWKDSWSIFNL